MMSRKIGCGTLVAIPVIGMFIIGGCPCPPGNLAPIASAGADQTVAPSAVVSLSGGASSDPEGQALSFRWQQTAGSPVALSDPNSANPSFSAPAANDVLSFQLTVTDCGLSSSDSVIITVNAAAPPPQDPWLYISCFGGDNVVAYRNPQGVNGNIAPNINLQGAQTQLFDPSDVIITANDTMLVSNFRPAGGAAPGGPARITGYLDAETANGNLAPDRNVQGAATLLNNPSALTLNRAQDLVFVSQSGSNTIRVYSNASSASFNGNLAPVRSITSLDLNSPVGVNFDASDNLYVADNGNNRIAVFSNASSANGNVNAARIITNAAFNNVADVYVDPQDRMYVVNRGAGRIDIFNNAASLNGARMPDTFLNIPGAGTLGEMAVDSNNTAYILDRTNSRVYVYDNIASRNGTIAPDRSIFGANTQITTPVGMFLVE